MTSTLTTTDTFYESTIRVDLGDNPNRPRPGRDWLANPYRVHQRIMWALDGAREQNRPLFRIYRDRVIVRTTTKPDWTKPFLSPDVGTRGHYQAAFMLEQDKDGPILPLAEPWNRELAVGGCYWFELMVNPRVCVPRGGNPVSPVFDVLGKASGEERRTPLKPGSKHAIRDPEQAMQWFRKQFSANVGFEPENATIISAQRIRAKKGPKKEMTAHAFTLAGILRVTDPVAAMNTLRQGIGPSKSLGCGMLCLGHRT